jgi:hypothetical protein
MKIMQRLVIPLKEKDYKKVGHQAHDLHLKKREGKDDKSKNINDGHVSLFTLAHDQCTWMALLLRDTLFEFAK